ncbi:MAG: FAD:protein FMN transferase [Phycisphaerales bacterium]
MEPAIEPVRQACEAMGTRFEIVLPVGSEAERARLVAAGEAALDEVRVWHRRLSFFEASSFLSHVNRHAAAAAVACEAEFFELLRLCRDAWRRTDGAFDPAIAGLMRAGGFRGAARDEEALKRAARRGGFARVEIDETARTVRFGEVGAGGAAEVALDFGAIGKGWALDRAGEVLREAGVRAALLHGGTSSVLAMGTPGNGEDDDAWVVGLAGAAGGESSGPDVVARLRDGALGTSSPSGREVVDEAGRAHGHVIDPRTGDSARAARLAAVACPSAAWADAWSTALLVDPGLAERMPGGWECAMAEDEAPGWRVWGGGRVIARPPTFRGGG